MADTIQTDLVGTRLVSARGARIGKIDRILSHGEDRWALVKLGMLGLHSALVPLKDAEEQGGQLAVPYELEWIRQAPGAEADGDQLDDREADRLHAHYGLERVAGATAADADADDIELPRETREAKPPAMDEDEDSPINKRRRERARELGIPEHE